MKSTTLRPLLMDDLIRLPYCVLCAIQLFTQSDLPTQDFHPTYRTLANHRRKVPKGSWRGLVPVRPPSISVGQCSPDVD